MFKGIDLFSDTLTQPTAAMKQAMFAAELGDEQKGEDPTTLKLEAMAADMLGFSAAMFFPSATMANQIAIRTWCEPGDELLAADICHLFNFEAGGPAVNAQVICKPIPTPTGIFSVDDVKKHYRYLNSVHQPVSKLLSIENTTNMGGGIAWTKEQLQSIVTVADELNLKKHMDGARLFNASVKTGLSPKQIASGFDSVTICLSKGLGCAVGALLVFDKAHYAKIRRFKQLMGGAMRQSGILAAAGIYALQNHITRLQEDHDNAAALAVGLSQHSKHIEVVNQPPATNMVFFHWLSTRVSPTEFNDLCVQKGVRFSQVGVNKFRAVTHLGITKKDIETTIKIINEICQAV